MSHYQVTVIWCDDCHTRFVPASLVANNADETREDAEALGWGTRTTQCGTVFDICPQCRTAGVWTDQDERAILAPDVTP